MFKSLCNSSFYFRITKFILGLSASVYLGFNFILRSGYSEVPIFIFSIISLLYVFFSSSFYSNVRSRFLWVFGLFFFSLWNCFLIFFHDGEVELYEPFAKLLFGSLVVLAFVYFPVKLIFVRAGLYFAALSLLFLFFTEYSGTGRFSNGMNPNKWSPLLLSYAVATFILFFQEKTTLPKVFAFISWFIFVVFILLAGSRATFLILLFVTFLILFFSLIRFKLLFLSLSLIFLIIFFSIFNTTIETRLKNFSSDIVSFNSDNLNNSTGFRYVMWKSGIASVKYKPLLGSGFNLSKSIKNYIPDSPGEADVIHRLNVHHYGSFHNMWVDTLVSQGFLGFFVLLFFFILSIKLIIKTNSLLMVGPLIAVGLNGLTESTLYMSILAGHLALAGAIFMNMEDEVQS